MNTAIQRTKVSRIIFLIAGALLAVAIMLLFTGCTKYVVDHPIPGAAATPVSEAQPTTPPPAANEYLKAFGDVKTWDDGVSLSVSAPAAFQATEYAMGATPGQAQVVFTVVLTNGTDQPLSSLVYPTAASGGSQAGEIFDSGNPAGNIGYGPTTSLLPGQSMEWLVAFSVADVNDITVEASPGFEYKNVIFTNRPF